MDTQMEKGHPFIDRVIDGIAAGGSILLSISACAFSIIGKFDAFQTLTITMLTFLCTEYVVHSFLLKAKYFKAKKDYPMWMNANELTSKFYDMNEYCKLVLNNSHGEQDLFVVTCKRLIDNLYYVLQAAAEDKRIEIASDFIINSKGVFEALNVTGEKTVELTFPIENIEDIALKTPEDKKFFETAYKMTVEKRVKEIRVLLILKEADFINDEKLQYLCSFYNENKAYECRYILKDDFVTACEHNLIPSNSLDFGIYGPQMLFKVEQYEPYKGVYTKNIEEVRRYRDLFNQVWDFESMTHDIKTTQKDITTPVVLFDKFEKSTTKDKTITPPSPIIIDSATTEIEGTSSETDNSEKGDANNNEPNSVAENLNSEQSETT